jgi:shikimate kinase
MGDRRVAFPHCTRSRIRTVKTALAGGEHPGTSGNQGGWMSIVSYGKRHLYLAGFMGTGKSAVGHLVARRLQRFFYDLDDVVVDMTNRSVDQIFRVEGETAFRQYEAKALRSIVVSAGAIIALGGGAPTIPVVADIMRQTGRVVLLTADWPVIWRRIKDDGTRPLLAAVAGDAIPNSTDRFERFVAHSDPILQSRRPAYHAVADWTIDTTELACEEVADQIVTWWQTSVVSHAFRVPESL